MEIISQSSEQTQAIAKILGQTILETKSSAGAIVLALQGDLGGGKTTFIQGLAQGLGIKQNLTSPTFVIMKNYGLSQKGESGPRSFGRRLRLLQDDGFVNFYHLDCYRLRGAQDLEILGSKEILADQRNIVAIEWAERVTKILPKDLVKIKFEVIDETTRKIDVTNARNKIQTKFKY